MFFSIPYFYGHNCFRYRVSFLPTILYNMFLKQKRFTKGDNQLYFNGHVCFRYTPLDYALMGEQHDVAQYMIDQGALSITGIQDIAALKIQVRLLVRKSV